MSRALLTATLLATTLLTAPANAQRADHFTPIDAAAADSVDEILRRFAADYENDPSLVLDVTFGVAVSHEDLWHVIARAPTETAPATVEVSRGAPPEPTFYFNVEYPTLVAIDRGEINAMTAMVRGLASDPAPMGTGAMQGFRPDSGFIETMLDLAFHFWTRGWPEIVSFGEERTRFVHGTDAVILYYEPGFRSGWFSLKKGQHANADPRLQVNPFPSLIVVTRGRAAGRVGGVERELDAGHAALIPAGVSHEFWNPYDEPAEGFLIMFGEGA